jgi:hypothetical protein
LQHRAVVRLGTSDWRHPEWEGMFYPPDMPPEWQLTYYNTQFSCVWLPASRWRGLAVDSLAQWVEDTGDHFRFLLDGVEEQRGAQAELVAALGDRLATPFPYARSAPIWFDSDTPLRDLASQIAARATEGRPLYVLSRDARLARLEEARELIGLLGL